MKIICGHKGRWIEFHTDEGGVPLFWTLLSGKVIKRVDLVDLARRCREAGIPPPTDGIRLACCGFWYTTTDDDGKELPGSQYADFDPDEWELYIDPPPEPEFEEPDEINEDEDDEGEEQQ